MYECLARGRGGSERARHEVNASNRGLHMVCTCTAFTQQVTLSRFCVWCDGGNKCLLIKLVVVADTNMGRLPTMRKSSTRS